MRVEDLRREEREDALEAGSDARINHIHVPWGVSASVGEQTEAEGPEEAWAAETVLVV